VALRFPSTGTTVLAPEDIIGAIDPKSIRETAQGLRVSGKLDLENSEKARQAWRAMKQGSIYLSFGYMTNASHTEGDVKVLDEIDLFEITLTPSANPDIASSR
jgi:HK97 family phage prohead protease